MHTTQAQASPQPKHTCAHCHLEKYTYLKDGLHLCSHCLLLPSLRGKEGRSKEGSKALPLGGKEASPVLLEALTILNMLLWGVALPYTFALWLVHP